MAKQAGPLFIEGTMDDLTFYKMQGKYYVRMKSSLNSKRFRKDKAFERSRESCRRFCEGNRLASRVYRMLEEEKRKYKLFCFLKKRAIQLLKEGKSLRKAEELLMDDLSAFGMIEKIKAKEECETIVRKFVISDEIMFAEKVADYERPKHGIRCSNMKTSISFFDD